MLMGDAEAARILGGRIPAARLAAGMTQRAQAAIVGLSRQHLQLLETGLSDRAKGAPSNPRLATIRALAAALGMPIADLLAPPLERQRPDRLDADPDAFVAHPSAVTSGWVAACPLRQTVAPTVG